MKKRFTFSMGEHIEADLEDLQRLLSENKQYLQNYEGGLQFLGRRRLCDPRQRFLRPQIQR